MAELQDQDGHLDPKLLGRLTLQDYEAPMNSPHGVREHMDRTRPQGRLKDLHPGALDPHATTFLPSSSSYENHVPSRNFRTSINIADNDLLGNHGQKGIVFPNVAGTNTHLARSNTINQSGNGLTNVVDRRGRPNASPLRYNPRYGFIPINSTDQVNQYPHHQYGYQSFSSAAPPVRQLAGNNGVPIHPSFFTPNDQPLILPDGKGKQARSPRPHKLPKSLALRPTEYFTPNRVYDHPKGAKSRLGTVKPHRSATPPRITQKPPKPTGLYLERASLEPQLLATPQRLLLVLDLNGTLLYRHRGSQAIKPRYELQPFLTYCLKYHDIMVWSSATPENVQGVCNRIFTPEQLDKLVAIWARDTLELSPSDYNEKVQVYKRLDRIWDNQDIQCKHSQYDTGGGWDQSNTLLIDDSALKAAGQPWNHVKIPEFLAEKGYQAREKQLQIFGLVAGFLHDLRRYNDVSRCLHKRAFGVPQENGIALPLAVHELDEQMEGWANSKPHAMIFED